MEKLSSILPSNPRVKSVDMTDAQPRRPGAPAFGAPVGRNTVQDRVTLSQAQAQAAGAAPEMLKDSPTYNPKDFRSSKSADYKTKDFFNNRLKPTESELTSSETILEGLDERFQETAAPAVSAKAVASTPERSQESFE